MDLRPDRWDWRKDDPVLPVAWTESSWAFTGLVRGFSRLVRAFLRLVGT